MKDLKNWRRTLFTVFALLILCTAFFNTDTALARPATAACAHHHTVESGDTLSKIATAYDVTLTALADANNLKSPYTIYIGRSLCIPKGGSSSSSSNSTYSSSSNFTATKKNEKLIIEVEDFPKNEGYFVRVQPVDGSRNWEKVGSLSTNKHGEGKTTITLESNKLKKAKQLNVCLKNIDDGELECTTTSASSSSSSSSSSNKNSSTDITATRKKDKLTIKVEDFPKNTGYFVRVQPSDGTRGWEKIGSLSTDKHGEGKVTITLESNALKKANELNVCLKNIDNNDLECTTTSASSSSNKTSTPLVFTVHVQNNQLIIRSTNSPKYEGYNVRVNDSPNSYQGKWKKIGTVTANSSGKIDKAIRLTGDYRKAEVLHVCLKNTSTDEVFCTTINP